MGTWGFESVILYLPPPHDFLCLLLFTIAGNLLPVTNLGIMEVSKWIDIVGLTYMTLVSKIWRVQKYVHALWFPHCGAESERWKEVS